MRLLIVAGILALAASASLTPANARPLVYGPHCFARIDGVAGRRICAQCTSQCRYVGANLVTPPDILACMATCVNAAEATRRKSSQ
jgi:hypothetical protein